MKHMSLSGGNVDNGGSAYVGVGGVCKTLHLTLDVAVNLKLL